MCLYLKKTRTGCGCVFLLLVLVAELALSFLFVYNISWSIIFNFRDLFLNDINYKKQKVNLNYQVSFP